ncbi:MULTISPECIES: NAD(P)H-hydrate dehydratase [Olivibacter]|uniref:Bifunctional NAD(P)H-hydrate repair enzyme n=2 Tax=Olivibacter TaxID=376469 RepID=A0ABV6HTY9_9SPHI|nr:MULTISPECIES: NAD(P)H-hydrate dehydratase [Olivibacter]MCL4638181.1 NAD(P)H-hydrate dehydratase [Olivibacter sp. UJ_SKK_5.1]MDM8173960.1 NAD(P)H-hydrate dehydratase [Olivibacter sp. 47]MDX3915145.1 NAD(P)H-hydrate dehydratase [Pseudosphingobacterium sp.]QEL03747.1 NAD(P)H-hydrate dehydratase [Olivibacter sp. LS-1]
MQNLLTASQIREVDAYTIINEPVSSIDLMERAAEAFVNKFVSLYTDRPSVIICCGTGNNGGDGLAIARLLFERGYTNIVVWIVRYNNKKTDDFEVNYKRLLTYSIQVQELFPAEQLPSITADVVIDALFGSGLNKPLIDPWRSLVRYINKEAKVVVSVDIPTGMPAEGNMETFENVIIAQDVITFQAPKISFLFPESGKFLKRFHVVDIGLHQGFMASLDTEFCSIMNDDIRSRLKVRENFSHKGTYGHACILAGNEHTMGAALLSAEACLYTGAGLTTVCIPSSGLSALNTRLPEVMALDRSKLSELGTGKYKSLGIGPGLGTGEEIRGCLSELLADDLPPLVLDADALNVVAANKNLLTLLKAETILTPHMKEFDRLFGHSDHWWDRVIKARTEASRRKLIIVLKNRYTFVALPDGKIWVNFTGNPAMASGGMGDVLTGILVALLAQGYKAADAAILGVFIHGKAGDLLAAEGMGVIPASCLIKKIPNVIEDFSSSI